MSSSEDGLPNGGQALRRAFESLIEVLNQRRVRYALIGGLASAHHTRARTTDDIDVLMTVPQLELPGLLESLQAGGFAIDLARNIREFRDEGVTTVRFGDVVADLFRPVIPAYAHVLDRAVVAEVLGKRVRVSSAEGLIVMKLIAFRPQDEADIQDLLAAHKGKLDVEFIRRELESFVDADDPRVARFEEWLAEESA